MADEAYSVERGLATTTYSPKKLGEVVARCALNPEVIVAEVDKQLDWIKRESYGVDVREKFNSANPVIDTVVSYNTAMHALLFIKQAAIASSPPQERT